MAADHTGGTVAYDDNLLLLQTAAHFLHKCIDIGIFLFPVVVMLWKDDRVLFLPHAAGIRPGHAREAGASGENRLPVPVLLIEYPFQLFQ